MIPGSTCRYWSSRGFWKYLVTGRSPQILEQTKNVDSGSLLNKPRGKSISSSRFRYSRSRVLTNVDTVNDKVGYAWHFSISRHLTLLDSFDGESYFGKYSTRISTPSASSDRFISRHRVIILDCSHSILQQLDHTNDSQSSITHIQCQV